MALDPRTTLGPLTTTFTQPTACSLAYIIAASIPTGFLGAHCPTTSDQTDPRFATTCWPPVTKNAPTPTYPINGWGFYSPGLICPVGYTSACTATHGAASGWQQQYSMTQGETAVGCCPTGFVCARVNAQSCVRTATSGDVLTISKCPMQPFLQTITLPGTISGSSTKQPVDSMSLQAPMIEIRWKSSDRPASSSSQTSTSNESSTSPTSGGSSGGRSSLSTGEKAAIGVVVPVAVIALVVGLLIFFRRRHKSSQRQSYGAGYEPSRQSGLPEINRDYDAQGYAQQPYESGGKSKPAHELITNANSHELGIRDPVHEVPDTSMRQGT